jgi:hypothetical protein
MLPQDTQEEAEDWARFHWGMLAQDSPRPSVKARAAAATDAKKKPKNRQAQTSVSLWPGSQ